MDPTQSAVAAARQPANTALDLVIARDQQPLQQTDVCPYPGLRAFREKDAKLFFGRRDMVCRLVEKLGGNRVLALIGRSGSGKSSLVQAGLIPALRAGALPGSAHWQVLLMTPGQSPLRELGARLAALENAADRATRLLTLKDGMRYYERTLHEALHASIAGDDASARLLVVVDQFEELFTLCRDERDRQRFLDNLFYAATAPRAKLMVVLVMRVDDYARAAAYPQLADCLASNQVLVCPQADLDLSAAIEGPVRKAGLTWERGLADQLYQDLAHLPRPLPLLAQALRELWEHRQGRRLTQASYRDMGGVQNAIAYGAERVFQRLTPAQQATARRIFLRLARFGEGVEDAGRRVRLSEFTAHGNQEPTLATVLRQLTAARMLITGHDPATGETRMELAHTALLWGWPRLQGWLQEARDSRHTRQRLRVQARQWQQQRRDRRRLLRDTPLQETERWAIDHDAEMGPLERRFLRASRALRARETDAREAGRRHELKQMRELAETQRELAHEHQLRSEEQQRITLRQRIRTEEKARTARRFRWLAGLLAVAMVVAIGAAVVAWDRMQAAHEFAKIAEINRLSAERQSRIARARQLAAQSNLYLEPNRRYSLLLAIEAVQTTRSVDGSGTAAAENSLRAALGKPNGMPSSGDEVPMWDVAFSPDGRSLAFAGDDHVIRLRSVDEPRSDIRVLAGHRGPVSAVTFSPDGKRLASASLDKTVRLWALDKLEDDPVVLRGHGDSVVTLAFSPEGRFLASAGDDHTVRLWKLDKPGSDPEVLRGHEAPISALAFSPDGRLLASASGSPFLGDEDNTVRLWWLRQLWRKPMVLRGHEGPVSALAFNPDGKLLASTSLDKTVRLWNIRKLGREPVILTGHHGPVTAVAFAPEGNLLASAGDDRRALLWDMRTPQHAPIALQGHEDTISALAFSPDGNLLVSTSLDKTVRLWQLRNLQSDPANLPGQGGAISAVTFSPNGNLLASTGEDGVILLRNLDQPEDDPITLRGPGGTLTALAISPDGHLIASSGDDRAVRLWDLSDPENEPSVLKGHTAPITALAFSPDGKLLASAGGSASPQSDDNRVLLWDLGNPREDPIALSHEQAPAAVAFSPDGRYLASGGLDNGILLRELRELAAEPRLLSGHQDALLALAFSPDGNLLASASDDRTVRLWQLQDLATAPEVLRSHEAPVGTVAFSPDGKLLASAGNDRTVRLWNLGNVRDDPVILRGHSDAVSDVAFSPDGKLLASAGNDHSVRLWRLQLDDLLALACQLAGRNFDWDEWQRLLGDEPYRQTCRNLPADPAMHQLHHSGWRVHQ